MSSIILRRKSRHHPAARGRAVVVWGLLFVVALKLGLLGFDHSQPYRRDPEFTRKIALLRTQLAEQPDRPLVLALGSSRTFNGFRAETLPEFRTPDGELATVFNFGMVGAGPIHQNLFLRRLLREGIQPRHLLMEVYPVLLNHLPDYHEEHWLYTRRMNWHDIQHVSRYVANPAELRSQWLLEQVSQRSLTDPLLQHQPQAIWQMVHGDGWLPWDNGKISEPPADFAQQLEKFRTDYYRGLADFQVTDRADQALRDSLALCREAGIQVTLVRMPEHSQLRDWYPPETNRQVNEYLAQLCTEFQLSQVDARTWCDDEVFVDGHHLMANGAEEFSQMLGRSVVQPLVVGRPLRSSQIVAENPTMILR